MNKEVLKALIGAAIQLLGQLIPWLGTFTGLPVIGWLISFGVSWLSGLLYDLIKRAATFNEIDADVAKQLTNAKVALAAFKAVQENPAADEVERVTTKENLRVAMRELTRFKLY